MAKDKQAGHTILAVLAGVSVLAALLTVIPHSSVGELCKLGYKALCPFAPISTLLCLVLASTACVMRKKSQ